MYNMIFKRTFDIIISILFLPLIGVLMVVIGLMIKTEDQGPIFYNANRLGKNGKVFKMYKFRSMKTGAPDIRNEDGSTYNSESDFRLTKIGKSIRETSLDETPQIINVLKGDMSIIGPRPNLPDDLETFQKDEEIKLKVRPGITGYTQAYYRNSITVRDRRLKDAWYAENLSFKLDLKILLKTIRTVIFKEGVYTNIHEK